MRSKHWLIVGILLAAGSFASQLHADVPWTRMAIFKRVEADPNKDYTLTEENGPWLIMAATFSGEGAEAQARELVHELRGTYHLPAYLHKQRFEHGSATATGLGVDRYGQPLKMKYLHKTNEVHQEWAVLVGDYPSASDAQASKDLRKIKDLEPKSLMPAELAKRGKNNYQQLASFRLQQKVADKFVPKDVTSQLQKKVQELAPGHLLFNPTRQYGPMGSAFLTRNPLQPKEERPLAVVDKFVYDMNKNVPHSLLHCKGKYTLKVATFTGSVVMDQKVIKELEAGKQQLKTRLEEAALKAHELTEALRLKGYEAYEFHDRTMSIVTVGSFDSAGTPRPDGKIEINPEVFRLMQLFGPQKTPSGQQQPQAIVGIPLDVQPLLIHVPKRSFAADYVGR